MLPSRRKVQRAAPLGKLNHRAIRIDVKEGLKTVRTSLKQLFVADHIADTLLLQPQGVF
jgi:hypothetical protein